jgi:hypothetical protein
MKRGKRRRRSVPVGKFSESPSRVKHAERETARHDGFSGGSEKGPDHDDSDTVGGQKPGLISVVGVMLLVRQLQVVGREEGSG